ncbi:TetR/AcrR family transcriptional regulator [Lacisediminihabitans profunda]|uniref:TetR/AcrR family transcriptional regulator n=1 Tax=Lacisediminihabitans profunda TaxID=2594790 RepID=A0A5C8UVM7_9MICO|nr:TetR/AcrR family transcriptional regulator [Lacisediminihabitans profunda]TXN32390.1 TetR/AcrR family transcriptional regulator [Lacisediminihabitans profunda]
MRADAKKNYDRLLSVARDVVTEHGADASLRDVARKADVGLGTLYRHFPTREALIEALLRTEVDGLTAQAAGLEESSEPKEALLTWLRGSVAITHEYRGVTGLLMAALEDSESALHASCVALHDTGTRLLDHAQAAGVARTDIDGTDLFALVAALAWVYDQPSLALRADHLFDVISGSVLPGQETARSA